MKTLCLKLEGLDCPNCAEKIRARVEKMDGVTFADMNFMNQKLTVKHDISEEKLHQQIEDIVKKLEPDVEVKPYEQELTKSERHTFDIIRLIVSGVLFALSFVIPNEITSAVLALIAYVIAGYDVVFSAFRNLFKGEAFDESLLMTIATVGAIALKDFREGAAVMIFFQLGELFQAIAVERSKKSIAKLMELKPETARVLRGESVAEISPDEVEVGDILLVKAGERIPLDGVVHEGFSELDTSAVTGEFLPAEVKVGDKVLSGCANLKGVLKIKVTNSFRESAVSKILDMVQNSTEKKAQTEKFITRFARVYTPVVVALAVLLVLIPSIITGFDEFSKWLYRGLLFLVISCPCALVISVPLSYFAGIGGASSKGILIKGANSLEALSKCRTLATDKTGTLTKGKFTVVEINPDGISKEELLELAAYCESGSTHPIGLSICNEYGKEMDVSRLSDEKEIAGHGISCKLDGKEILCGKAELLKSAGISVPQGNPLYTAVYIAVDGKFAGEIMLGDEIKESTTPAISRLKSQGIETVLLTGDRKAAAEAVADKTGISTVYAELLPENKVEKVEELMSNPERQLVAFAGDGINDAPVIARADIGIAMGGLGSDIAIEAADVVLMNDDPMSIASAIFISHKTMSIVKQNIIFALGIKALVLFLGAIGFAGMWSAVFADVGVTVIAVLNAFRASKV
ncbi:MAG: heavy metal translocating P-type ATPase [Hominimerdicola sp.]